VSRGCEHFCGEAVGSADRLKQTRRKWRRRSRDEPPAPLSHFTRSSQVAPDGLEAAGNGVVQALSEALSPELTPCEIALARMGAVPLERVLVVLSENNAAIYDGFA
jgi:hypothetical protein